MVVSIIRWSCLGQRSLEAVVGEYSQGAATHAETSGPLAFVGVNLLAEQGGVVRSAPGT